MTLQIPNGLVGSIKGPSTAIALVRLSLVGAVAFLASESAS